RLLVRRTLAPGGSVGGIDRRGDGKDRRGGGAGTAGRVTTRHRHDRGSRRAPVQARPTHAARIRTDKAPRCRRFPDPYTFALPERGESLRPRTPRAVGRQGLSRWVGR